MENQFIIVEKEAGLGWGSNLPKLILSSQEPMRYFAILNIENDNFHIQRHPL